MSEFLHDDDLARAMIEMHGNHAATVARSNARTAAVAGQLSPARNWLKIVETIQRRNRGQS
jgi:hypothetical protein